MKTLNATLILPDSKKEIKQQNVKISLYRVDHSEEPFFNRIRTNYIIDFDPNYMPVLNKDFEFNNEPYYDPTDFEFLKIQTETRENALEIIDQRYTIDLLIKEKGNKGVKENFILHLHNCSVYELKRNNVIVKPSDIRYVSNEDS